MKLLILLTVLYLSASYADITDEFDFFAGGRYTARGSSKSYAKNLGLRFDVNDSYISIDPANNRIAWRTGGGGDSWYNQNGTYGTLEVLYPGVCFVVRKRAPDNETLGEDFTVFDEIEGYKNALNTHNVTTKRRIRVQHTNNEVERLRRSKDAVYTGLVDEAQRCGYPAMTTMFVNMEYGFLTGIGFNQRFVIPTGIPEYPLLPTNSYLAIEYDDIKFAINDADHTLPASCSNPVELLDWCDTWGGYLPLVPLLGGY